MSTIDRVDASTRVAHRVYARLSHSRGLYEHCGDGVHAPVLPAQRMQGSAGAATRDPLVAAKSESVALRDSSTFDGQCGYASCGLSDTLGVRLLRLLARLL